MNGFIKVSPFMRTEYIFKKKLNVQALRSLKNCSHKPNTCAASA